MLTDSGKKIIDCIVYTKDRTCQLDLLMRSVRDMFESVGRVFILYTYSNDEYRLGFEKFFRNLRKYNLDIVGVLQDNFEQDVNKIIRAMSTDCFLGLCDDDVFITKTDCSDIIKKLSHPDVSAISLKAGLNILGNYPDIVTEFPDFIEKDPYLKWEWLKSRPDVDWGYPTCVNSYIFMRDYFLYLIRDFHFHCPPYLEMGLNLNRAKFRKYMMSFRQSKMLNIPVNRMQSLSPNAFSTKYFYEISDLNKRFLDGHVISTKNMYDISIMMGNEEREFVYENEQL